MHAVSFVINALSCFIIFSAALLLCDYGTPSPSTSEMPTDAISSISDSNTTVTTAKSVTVGNGLSTLESGLGQNQSNDLSSTTESSTDLSESGRVNGSGSIIRVISSTARPESTTRDVKHHTTKKKPGWRISIDLGGSGQWKLLSLYYSILRLSLNALYYCCVFVL